METNCLSTFGLQYDILKKKYETQSTNKLDHNIGNSVVEDLHSKEELINQLAKEHLHSKTNRNENRRRKHSHTEKKDSFNVNKIKDLFYNSNSNVKRQQSSTEHSELKNIIYQYNDNEKTKRDLSNKEMIINPSTGEDLLSTTNKNQNRRRKNTYGENQNSFKVNKLEDLFNDPDRNVKRQQSSTKDVDLTNIVSRKNKISKAERDLNDKENVANTLTSQDLPTPTNRIRNRRKQNKHTEDQNLLNVRKLDDLFYDPDRIAKRQQSSIEHRGINSQYTNPRITKQRRSDDHDKRTRSKRRSLLPDPVFEMVPKGGWDDEAKEQTTLVTFAAPANHIKYRSTGSKGCETRQECIARLRKIQKQNKEDGYPDIKYNFLVGGDNAIYEGKGWDTRKEEVAHIEANSTTISHRRSVAIAFIGKFRRIRRPPPDMLFAAYDFVNYAIKRKKIDRDFTFSHIIE